MNKNIRHISLSNILNISFNNGTSVLKLDRNINCISLNNSLKYNIKNLNINIGSLEFDTATIISIPIRFFLSDRPVEDSIYNYTTTQIVFNGIVNPTSYDYNTLDICDSTNINNNLLSTTQNYTIPTVIPKNNTVYESYLNQINRTKYDYSLTNSAYNLFSIPTVLSDFHFNSNNENNLVITTFPFNFNTSGTFSLSATFSINFDLIEEPL